MHIPIDHFTQVPQNAQRTVRKPESARAAWGRLIADIVISSVLLAAGLFGYVFVYQLLSALQL